MVVTQKYNIIDMEKGLLERSIFTDPRIYQDELEKIFGQAWLMIGHDSLVPNPNDFFLSYMGEDPVILTRDSKGALHVFLNMCRHRGNRVVRADDGNAKNFMCTYHGWTFSNEGKLVSVPGLQEAYYGELDVENLGLVSVAQLDTYAGIVYATWAEDAPTLEAYLGDARWYKDTVFNRRDNGMQLLGPVKWILPANWKTPVDNTTDHAHGLITHRSSVIVQNRFKGSEDKVYLDGHLRFMQPGRQVTAGNGHGLMANVRDEDRGPSNAGRTGTRAWDQEKEMMRAYAEATQAEVERRLGTYRARRVSGTGAVFPNVFLGLHMAHPRGPNNTEMWTFVEFDKDAPEDVKRATTRNFPQSSAAHLSSIHAQDDMNNWQQVTASGRYTSARGLPQDLSMGIGFDRKDPKFPGVGVSQSFCAETGQRGYYARWQEFMNAEGWADIHIDPITVTFEGTATMHG